MPKQRMFAEIFGLAVRFLGLWTLFQGFIFLRNAIAMGMGGRQSGEVWPGVIVTIIGMGIMRYADVVVRFSYRELHDSDDDRAE